MEAVAVKQAESVRSTLNLEQVGLGVTRWG